MLSLKRSVNTHAMVGRIAHVREPIDDSTVLLTDGCFARVAASCLLQPQRGDRVVLSELGNGETFLHAILERDVTRPANLQVPRTERVTLAATQLVVAARESLEIRSLHDVEVAAVTGTLSITAPSVTVTAVDSFVQTARQYLANIGTYALQVSSLLRMHGQQAILTAQHDMKLDAERINVG